MVATGKASVSLHDSFEEERHPLGAKVLQMAKARTALIKAGTQIEALREIVNTMVEVPEVTLHLSRILSGLGIRYDWGEGFHPMLGQRIPNIKLLINGVEKDLFSLMHKARPLLLNFNIEDNIEIPDAYQSSIDIIKGVPIVKGNSSIGTYLQSEKCLLSIVFSLDQTDLWRGFKRQKNSLTAKD